MRGAEDSKCPGQFVWFARACLRLELISKKLHSTGWASKCDALRTDGTQCWEVCPLGQNPRLWWEYRAEQPGIQGKPSALSRSLEDPAGDWRKGCIGSPYTMSVKDPLVGRRPTNGEETTFRPLFLHFSLCSSGSVRWCLKDAQRCPRDCGMPLAFILSTQSPICCLERHRRQDHGLNKVWNWWCVGGQVVAGPRQAPPTNNNYGE